MTQPLVYEDEGGMASVLAPIVGTIHDGSGAIGRVITNASDKPECKDCAWRFSPDHLRPQAQCYHVEISIKCSHGGACVKTFEWD
jgi:hypothetical protein